MLEALKKTLGVVTSACQMSDVGRTQFYTWMKTDPKFKEEVDEIADVALDFAESKLFQAMKKESIGAVTATIFYLKTKGKKRGYIERTEFTGKDGERLYRDPFDDMEDEEIEAELKKIKETRSENA